MKKSFEIPVYNTEVREAIQNKHLHANLEAKWADIHLIMIRAHTADEALAICRRKHPEKMGFVLGDVSESI